MKETHRLFRRPKLQPVMSADEFQRLPSDKSAVVTIVNKPLILKKMLLPSERENNDKSDNESKEIEDKNEVSTNE